jgi:hypothetical protein|tara:strand:+ start:481 stop:639 length:159 start_codon:yes stop_codon:yes gene_type:complete
MKNKKKTVLTIDDKIIGEVYLDNIMKSLKRGIYPKMTISRYMHLIKKYKNKN